MPYETLGTSDRPKKLYKLNESKRTEAKGQKTSFRGISSITFVDRSCIS